MVTAKGGPERATKTRQNDWLRSNEGQKEPPRLGNTICYGQEWTRKSHQDSAVRFVTAKMARKSHQDSVVRFVTAKSCPEKATKTWQYDLLRPRIGQKEPPRLGNTICYGQELPRKSHQDSAVRFKTAKGWPEGATKIRQYDLLWPRIGQKEPPRLGSTICYGQTSARKSHQDSVVPPRLGSTICYDQELTRRSHQDSAVQFVTAKSCPERATKIRQYDLLRPNVGHRDSAVRFVTAKSGPEKATKIRQYDLLRPRVGLKKPPRLGSTICYGQQNSMGPSPLGGLRGGFKGGFKGALRGGQRGAFKRPL